MPARHTLCRQGEPRRHIFLIVSGRVKVTRLGAEGDEVILWLKGPGDVLGGLGLSAGTPHECGAQSIEPCYVIFWEAHAMECLSERCPVLQRNTVKLLAQCLDGIQDRFYELATENVASRLARNLIRLAACVGHPAGEAARINLGRQELAQMTGTTVFAVSRLLSEWTQRGIIDARRGMVLVYDDSRLVELAGEGLQAPSTRVKTNEISK